MPWLQIKIPTRPDHTEALEDALLLAGCQAVTLLDTADKPVFEPIRGTTPLWEHTTVQGLFEDDIDSAELVSTMERFASETQLTVGTITTEILEDKDWEREWMDNFSPIQCGDRLWIVPSWLEAPVASAINLKLDPGLAFGTGTHPTTYLCLKWMDKHIEDGDLILDFGCGSGILGLAGILLGAEHMDGIDIDPQAITATRNNAETNVINASKFHVTTDSEDLADEYDTVIANILAGTLVDLSTLILSKLKTRGHLVLSGILDHQAETVIEAFSHQIDFQPTSEKDGWVCLSGQKK
jgi:ribosomal protein L11 methyltransferase